MKIKNDTNYSTREIRKIFMACEKHEGTNYQYRNVRVIPCRGRRVHGYAWYNSNSVVIKLPKRPITSQDKDSYAASIHRLAQVYIHEIGHNQNLRHSEMANWWDIDVSFVGDDGFIPLKAIKSKPKKSAVEKREDNAIKKLEEWTKKLNRAKTFVKKYKTKVKYYEKRKAASIKGK